MKSKTVILMVVAIACGLAASYMTSRVIAERDAKPDVEKVSVLVAKRNIGMGTLINDPEKFFEEKQFVRGEEPKKAIRNYDELKNQRLNKPLSAEQFVTADDLWDKEKDGLAGRMRKGYRAVGLNVNAQTASGGFVLPNSHVDIVSVITDQKTNKTSSKIILQNILVLAVDQLSSRPDDKSAVVANTVTVEVTPEQAQRLALAQRLGTISLILRAFDDDAKVATTQAADGQGTDNPLDEQFTPDDTGPRRTPIVSKIPDVPVGPGITYESNSRRVHIMTIFNGEHVRQEAFQLDDKGEVVPTKIEKSKPEADATPKTTGEKP